MNHADLKVSVPLSPPKPSEQSLPPQGGRDFCFMKSPSHGYMSEGVFIKQKLPAGSLL